MTGVVYKSRKFGAQVFWTFIQVAWNDTIQSVHGWCSRKQHSCRLSERQEIGTVKGGKKEAAWQLKEVSRSPVNALQSLYGPVFPTKFSIPMKLVLMTIRIKAILLDLQYSDISSIGKRWQTTQWQWWPSWIPYDSDRNPIKFAIQHPKISNDTTEPLAVRSRRNRPC